MKRLSTLAAWLLITTLKTYAQETIENKTFTVEIPNGMILSKGNSDPTTKSYDNDGLGLSIRVGSNTGQFTAMTYLQKVEEMLQAKKDVKNVKIDPTEATEINGALLFHKVERYTDNKGINSIMQVYTFDDTRMNVFFFTFYYADKQEKECTQVVNSVLKSFKPKMIIAHHPCLDFTYPANWFTYYKDPQSSYTDRPISITTNIPCRANPSFEYKVSMDFSCDDEKDIEKVIKEQKKKLKKLEFSDFTVEEATVDNTKLKVMYYRLHNSQDITCRMLFVTKNNHTFIISSENAYDEFAIDQINKAMLRFINQATFK